MLRKLLMFVKLKTQQQKEFKPSIDKLEIAAANTTRIKPFGGIEVHAFRWLCKHLFPICVLYYEVWLFSKKIIPTT